MATKQKPRQQKELWEIEANNYVRGYARRNKIKVKEARQLEIVQNVIAWIKLRYGKGTKHE